MEKITVARYSMATRFEIVLVGESAVSLRAAGEEALGEIERVESQLSLYKPSSEIFEVNAWAAERPVRVSPEVFHLIEKARALSSLACGVFDISAGPLIRCWGFMKGSGERPKDEEIARAREVVGSDLLELDSAHSTIRFSKPGMMVDLGSIGKGYALDLAAEILRDAGISNALLHGGTSTIVALGEESPGRPWRVGIEGAPSEEGTRPTALAVVELRDEALSVSAVWGKSFEMEGRRYGHVIDPRTGWPAPHGLLAAVLHQSATESDALSTAVLLLESRELLELQGRMPALRYLRLDETGRQAHQWPDWPALGATSDSTITAVP